MHQCHATEERDHAGKCKPVFLEQLFRSNISSADPKQYYNGREDRTPPADEESRFIITGGSCWRRRRVYGHGHTELPRSSTSAEGTSEELEVFAVVVLYVEITTNWPHSGRDF
jgi:hypothetical protein